MTSLLCLPFHAATYILVPYRNTAQKPPAKRAIRRRRRRKLNVVKTMETYQQRILSTMRHRLPELEGAYLSTFSVFSTESEDRAHWAHDNSFVLMRLARQHGVRVKAVTSECKVGGQYRAPLLNDDTHATAKIVYVGSYNYFTQHSETDWSLLQEDKVFHDLE